ncbi:hypothetical protein BC827DRAFT_414781 [Russula dissimulans]|nr:hypothetical protein BC827DRAFT_414781 [Russula dissimulans]
MALLVGHPPIFPRQAQPPGTCVLCGEKFSLAYYQFRIHHERSFVSVHLVLEHAETLNRNMRCKRKGFKMFQSHEMNPCAQQGVFGRATKCACRYPQVFQERTKAGHEGTRRGSLVKKKGIEFENDKPTSRPLPAVSGDCSGSSRWSPFSITIGNVPVQL